MAVTSVRGQQVPPQGTAGYTSAVHFQLLGPLAVSEDDGPIAIGGPKQRLVLAHLLLSANQIVSSDHLIDALWGEDPPQTARGTLQSYISRLRSALGSERIRRGSGGYALRAAPEEIDVHRFETLLREAREQGREPRRAVELLDEALALWRGPALTDLSAEPSLQGEISRLHEMRLSAGEERISAHLDLGEHADLVAELEAATVAHPLRERLWGQLVLALYRSGRQAEALVAFDRARQLLAEKLGIEPSRELQELHGRVLRQEESLRPPGGPLRGYRLLGKVGEGALGAVFRAIQPQVEREVAVKSIHAGLANEPDFVRRFEREAQLVARLEHPHIVPLYDYWREPNAAFLVMRFLRGGSLEDLLRQGPLELDHVARILDQIGGALATAHRQGVVHQAVKPGNILLDEAGNAYLSDFGIGLEARASARSIGAMGRRAPAYLSPEQIRLEQATPRSDVYALGVLLYEMLTREHPFPGASPSELLDLLLHHPIPSVNGRRPEVPVAVDHVIARATAKDPDARLADVLELPAAYRTAIDGKRRAVAFGQPRNPYKGLRAFLEADAADFFGREHLTGRLVERLAEPGAARFLCVVGPSGSGKSSVVRAGLVPAIRRGALVGSERWYVLTLLPGSHPMRELERGLLGMSVDPPPSLLEELERDELGLTRAVTRLLPDPDAELLIVVDQLEEVFTMVESEAERAHALDSLRAAAIDPAGRARVIATLRADFFDRPLSVRGFGTLLAARNEAIAPMSPEELERAIVGPAERVGLDVEPALVTTMVADVIDRPGALPLLQYTLTELADRTEAAALTLDGYRRVGGVPGALARRAEHLFNVLDGGGRAACRQLFLRLVTLGEGGEDTRLRVRRSELAVSNADPVIEAFGRHRLLSFDRDPATREPTIEIAHEALLRAWSRLQTWIDQARGDLQTRAALAAASTGWAASGRDESFLLAGGRLEQMASWAEASPVELSALEEGFLEASLARRRREEEREEERRQRELALERRSARRARSLVAVFAVAALIAGSLTLIATDQRRRAERGSRVATARALASVAEANLDVDPERSILFALEALEATRSDGFALPQAVQALHDGMAADRLLYTLRDPSTANVAYSPDGRLLATGGTAGGKAQEDVVIWDAATGVQLHRLEGHTGDISFVAFSPDSTRVVTTAGVPDARTIVWDSRSGEQLLVIDGDRPSNLNQGATFSPDGSRIAIGELRVGPSGAWLGGFVRVVDATTGAEVGRVPAGDACAGPPTYTPDGRLIVVPGIERGTLGVLDAGTLDVLLTLSQPTCSIAVSPDGTRVAAGLDELNVWDLRTGELLFSRPAPEGIIGLDWSPDGRSIASGGQDGIARIWDAADGTERLTLAGHTGLVALVAFSPDGTRLLTGGGDGTARVWDITPTGTAEILGVVEPGGINTLEFDADGTRLLTGGNSGRSWLWDSSSGARVAGFPDAWSSTFGADGTIVTLGRHIRVVDGSSGERIATIAPNHGEVGGEPWGLHVSPDGTRIALYGEGGIVTILDAASHKVLEQLGEPAGPFDDMVDAAFSPDGKLLAGLSGLATLYLWDVATGEELLRFQAQTGLASAVAFSPDGTMLATAGADGASVWSVPSGERVAAMRDAGRIGDVAFSPDGALIATAGDDGLARVWRSRTGQQVVALGGRSAMSRIAFSPDGARLATSDVDGLVRVFTLQLPELIRLARSRVTRRLTDDECVRYLHLAACPEAAGSGAPTEAAPPPPPKPIGLGPEGAYRTTIAADDLPTSLPPRRIKRNSGSFTWSLSSGIWRLDHEAPNGSRDGWSGRYSVSGDRITLTVERSDPICLGTTLSGRWSLGASTLSLAEVTVDGPTRCSDGPALGIWIRVLFEARPWLRVS